jgi:hypothetical protein
MSTTHKPSQTWTLLLAVAVCFAAPAIAGESRWYVEAKAGQSNLDADLGAPFEGWTLDDEVTSAGIEVGYTIHRYFAVQAGYRDLGSTPALPPPCTFCELDENLFIPLDASISALSLAAVPRWPISERLSLYGKLGVFHWDADVDFALDDSQVGNTSEEELLAAVGAHYGWPSGFGVLLEYEVVTDLFDGANLGITWHF